MKREISKPVLIVIDMQQDFVAEGASIECYGAREIIPNIKKLLDIMGDLKYPVIFTKEVHRPNGSDFGIELRKFPKHCIEGSGGEKVVNELSPKKGDYVINKRRYSAFYETDLEILLKGLKADTLILTGVATDICVRATAQDAQQKDYCVIVPENCVSGTDVEAHQSNLKDINKTYGDVLPLSKVISLLKGKT